MPLLMVFGTPASSKGALHGRFKRAGLMGAARLLDLAGLQLIATKQEMLDAAYGLDSGRLSLDAAADWLKQRARPKNPLLRAIDWLAHLVVVR